MEYWGSASDRIKGKVGGWDSSDDDEDKFLGRLGGGDDDDDEAEGIIPQQEAFRIGTTSSLTFTGLDRKVEILEDSSAGCGGKTWEAATVMAEHLIHRWSNNHDFLRGKKVVELGAGTGAVGILTAMLFPPGDCGQVIITDMLFLDLMQRNVDLNLTEDERRLVKVEELRWGSPVQSSMQNCDLILASDCVYLESTFDILLETLVNLSGDNTEALIVSKKRRKADKRFFDKLRKVFEVTEIKDDPSYDVYAKNGLSILSARLKKRNLRRLL